MTRPPPIEFLLHPPSPRHPCTLPPVSSLLSDVTPYHSSSSSSSLNQPHSSPKGQTLPSIPSLQLPDNKPYAPSSLMLSIPYHPSPSSTSSSPSSSPFLSYQSLDTPLSSPGSSPLHPPSFLLPPLPETGGRSRSHSNASTCSWSSVATSLAVTAPSSPILIPEQPPQLHTHHHQLQQQRRLSDPSLFPSPPSPASSVSTDPILKRKRGRPPNATSRQVQHDHWTFVPPTVWDVKRTDRSDFVESSTTTTTTSTSTISTATTKNNNEGMLVLWPEVDQQNTFTSTRMDTTLTMPKKKRGRKPKTQLAGNSCFVWRDLTARRGANRVKKTTAAPPRIAKKQQPSPPLSKPTQIEQEEETAIVDWTKDLSLYDK